MNQSRPDFRFVPLLAGILWCGTLTPVAIGQVLAPGEIVYNNYDTSTGQALLQLSVINPNGTGDSRIPVNLPEPAYPAVSRDGTLVAVTAADPKKAFTLSRDVFILNPPSGQLAQLTSFPNIWTHMDTNPANGTYNVSGTGYTLPYYKAFSPDGQKLAVSADVVSVATLTYTNSLTNPQLGYDLAGTTTTTPTLSIYNLNGTPGPLLVATASGADIHAGDGVDWSPAADLLVWPKDIDVIFGGFYGGTAGPVTALFAMAPVSDALGTGQGKQITFPQSEAGILPNLSGTYISWETDYQPAFSPDGKRIAYIRAISVKASTILGYVSTPSLRIVNADGSNDSAILEFQTGQYVTHVTWSPDGTRLAFDAGTQLVGPGGFPYFLADPADDALYLVNSDGTKPQKLRNASTWPVWTTATAPAPAPALTISLAPQHGQVSLAWPTGTANWTLESSSALGPQANWQIVPAQPSVAGSQQTITLQSPGTTLFFRLSHP
jgi:WD40-like Beta Propeller Repeat